jgi:hypothetical protein
MTIVADAFRLTYETREALKSYDASTLEDFCLMTEYDFESMLITETRLQRPICPLHQRKVLVLLRWIHQVSEDSAVERAARQFTKTCSKKSVNADEANPPPFLNRLSDPFGTMRNFHHRTMSSIKTVASFGSSASTSPSSSSGSHSGKVGSLKDDFKYVIIPEDWQARFRADLPKLKQTLYRERDTVYTERWSLLGDTFLAARWIFCGYQH